MSTQYNIEPPPKGQCVLHTSSGDVHLELFAQQTPIASRNFLQHILDGYYTNTIFHRLVPNFIIQGGDPTGTGSGGESSYTGGAPFADEFHPRLKFNRRGLLGMANGGYKNDNGSQFFLTLGKCDELTGRHTMFGRVVGNTIFNLVKMGEAELAEGEGCERPLYPTRVTGAEIIENPFEDMSPRIRIAPVAQEGGDRPKKRRKKKAGKSILSFISEDGEGDELIGIDREAKFNESIIDNLPENGPSHRPRNETSRARLNPAIDDSKTPSPTLSQPFLSDPTQRLNPQSSTPEPLSPITNSSRPFEQNQVSKVNNLLEKTNAQIAELKSSLKRNNFVTSAPKSHKKSMLEAMIPASATRGRKRGSGSNTAYQEQRTLEAFNAFKKKLEILDLANNRHAQQPADDPIEITEVNESTETNGTFQEANSVSADDEASLCDLHFIANCQSCNNWATQVDGMRSFEDGDGSGWMSHSLSFAKDRLGKSLEWKRKNEEELLVIDPREKTKVITKGDRKSRNRDKHR